MKLSNRADFGGFQGKNAADATDDQDLVTLAQVKARSIQLPFAWGDATPAPIFTVPGDKLVYRVEIHISVGFDGASPELTVGDAGDTDRLMAAAQNDPTTPGTYATHPSHRYGADTAVSLGITPGAGATAGRGLVTLSIEQ
jgi:hypothetical protein